MIESVYLSSWERGVEETLYLGKSNNGIRIADIQGLGPVTAQFNSSARVGGVGMNHNSTQIGARNIVFELELTAVRRGRTVEDSRYAIYDFFPVGEMVEMVFKSGTKMRQIFGRVESVEPEIFAKEPTVQVSVLCDDPYFTKYPIADDSVVLPNDGSAITINYDGGIATGITLDVVVLNQGAAPSAGAFSMKQITAGYPDRGLRVEDFNLTAILSGYRLRSGDEMKITTIVGQKSAILNRPLFNESYNIIGALTGNDGGGLFLKESQWPLLRPKKSTSLSYDSTNFPETQLVVTASWATLYEGL